MVAAISLGRMSAAFAAARDSLASSLNKSLGGATIACSITAFPFATTVKVVPSPNPHPTRIASGMTTCPREDILVVGTATIKTSLVLIGKNEVNYTTLPPSAQQANEYACQPPLYGISTVTRFSCPLWLKSNPRTASHYTAK
jgi:hypothetical protein